MAPRMLVSRGGREVLVEQGADLDRRGSEGWTALMFRMDRARVGEVVRLLLD